MDNKLLKKLRKKSKQTLRKEKAEIQDRQSVIRNRRDILIEERERLRGDLYVAMKALDTSSEELLVKQIADIRDDIAELNAEYKSNAEALECYAKVFKDGDEGKASLLGTFFTGIGTGAAIWLGKKSLDRAYEANTEGRLVNKGPLDVFNRLNPTKILSIFTHRK